MRSNSILKDRRAAPNKFKNEVALLNARTRERVAAGPLHCIDCGSLLHPRRVMWRIEGEGDSLQVEPMCAYVEADACLLRQDRRE
jgi:hypothetical protein